MTNIRREEFWEWAFSDFMTNSLRGVLAEFIVAKALNCTASPHIEWNAYDLVALDGTKIEVKSSAYLQTWAQMKPSAIRFDIARKQSWFAESNETSMTLARPADIYVFCVFCENRKETANPLDLTQWFFLVANTQFLNSRYSNQKSVTLSSLEQHGLKRLSFTELAAAVADSVKATSTVP